MGRELLSLTRHSYYRIISESQGYADNYEDVNFCGSMRWAVDGFGGELRA